MFEDSFIYYPSKYPEGRWNLASHPPGPGEPLLQIEDRVLTTSDGLRIHGWLCSSHVGQASSLSPQIQREAAAGENLSHAGQASSLSPEPQRRIAPEESHSQVATAASNESPPPTEPMILFLHGNAGNVTDRYELIRGLVEIPARVFIIDYRGYGKSEGTPSEHGIYDDARAAWDYLTRELGIAPAKIVIYGESLGGAVAVDLAAKENPAGVIVQSSFTSMPDMVSHVAPGFPRFLLRTRMNSLGKITKIGCPKLIVHGQADDLVPFEHGKRLYAASADPKQFYEIPGAGHNDVFQTGGKAYLATLRAFVNQTCCQ